MDLYAFASILVRYRVAAASVLGVTLVASILLCLFLPRKYTSDFTILSRDGGENSLLQTLNQTLYNTGMKRWVLPKVIGNDEFLEDVLKKSFPIWKDGKPVQMSLASLTGENGRQALLEKADKIIRVGVDQMTGSVNVGVESPFPELSYKAAEYMLSKLDAYTSGTREELRQGNAVFYQSRVAEARSGLRLVEGELGEYLKNNRGWLESDDPGARMELKRLKRKQKVYAGVYYELNKQREIEDLKLVALVPPLEVLDHPKIPTLKSFPKRKIILAAGMLAGVFLSVSTVFSWDLYRRFKPARSV